VDYYTRDTRWRLSYPLRLGNDVTALPACDQPRLALPWQNRRGAAVGGLRATLP